MKVWKATFNEPDMGRLVFWGTTKALALKLAREGQEANPVDDPDEITVEPVEIPTDKQGLVRWLNWNAGSDNG